MRDPDVGRRAPSTASTAVSHQAAMVGLGVDLGDIADYVSHNDLGTAVLLRALAARGSPGRSCSPRAWSSTARAATAAPSTGSSGPAPRARRGSRRRPLRAAVPGAAGATLDARGRPRGRAAGPAQRLRRDQGRAGAPVRRVRARDGRDGHRAALPQRLRPADAARHAVRRRGQHLPLRAGRRPRAARVRGRRAAARLRARARRRRAPTCSRSRPASPGAFNVASGTPRTVGEMAAALARAIDGPPPEVTGEWRGGRRAPRVRVRRKRAATELGFRAEEDFEAGHARVRGREAARMTRFAVVGHVEWIEFGRFTHVPEPGEIIDAQRVVLRGRRQRGGRRRPAREALRRRRLLHRARRRRARPARRASGSSELGVRVHAAPRDAMQRWGFVHLDDDGERTISIVGERHAPHGDGRPAVGAARRRRRRLRLRRRPRRDARGPAREAARRHAARRRVAGRHPDRRARRQRQGPARAGRPGRARPAARS